ncbi:kinesin family protein [Ophiocordyceps camponoti-floridani]|uniref:Kinesin family protein n=1 Tax=Ophiocordyceps camponoti-floridani TaxID=2030778 RepID=A0A8H4Q7P3_9HYPO|nr:kinesin family protein [Ophiocordyceps camponoti-floridani]
MSVRVVARIRPLLDKELDKDIIVRPEGGSEPGKPKTIVKIPNPKNESEDFSFTFNGVYDQSATQEALYAGEVQPHLRSLFQGCDVTIFAYGVTGTGKTHTMRGGLRLADRGVIPRLLSGIFRRSKRIAKDSDGQTEVRVALSYYEIYNDKVFDLLEPPERRTPSGLPLRAEASGKTVVVGLSERACSDLGDFEKLYIEANNNRVTAATKLNAHSSRSHAILRVKLTQATGSTVLESTASAIDLAGSEDNRRTENGKERLVESAAINKSLFVLSQCIEAISRGDRRIPYRESKMTRILSLGQNQGITVMILNLAPLRSYHLDTLSSLNVSSRAKRIEVRETENEVVFKTAPKPALPVATGPRQPLRPLQNSHNVAVTARPARSGDGKPPPPPVKSFSVYPDKRPPPPVPPPRPGGLQRPSGACSKRPSSEPDTETTAGPRQAKAARPAAKFALPSPPVGMSAAEIEAMVEKKVGEMLAAAHPPVTTPDAAIVIAQPDISEAVRKRLEALERRLESDDWRGDPKSDGLQHLLAARQHKERGDKVAALRDYEAALPFFPGQPKLLGKIERLRSLLGVTVPGRSPERHLAIVSHDQHHRHHRDVGWAAAAAAAAASARSRPRKAGPKPATEPEAFPLPPGSPTAPPASIPPSPRTRRLLAVVNSRDPLQMRGLVGFGAKRAADAVERLATDHPGRIETLDQLRSIPGFGGRTVDRAYEGLAAEWRLCPL